ncbi:MAG: hypothetical protein QOI07_2623 [Verrucomicrobiota bacterium]|jgi:hypothetical protein
MNFPIDNTKATEAVARLLERGGGKADYLRIVKLIYLADRDSIIRRGVPIVGGSYFSMRCGPTVGEVMKFANLERHNAEWEKHISPRQGNTLVLKEAPEYNHLSQSELDILDGVVEEHAARSTWGLVKWCHVYCREYERVWLGRKDIHVESILRAGGKTADRIHRVVCEAADRADLVALLA